MSSYPFIIYFPGHLIKWTKFFPFPLALYLFELTLCDCKPKSYHQLSPSDWSRSGDQVQLQHLDSSLSVQSRKEAPRARGIQSRMEMKTLPTKVSPAVSKVYEQKEGMEAESFINSRHLAICTYILGTQYTSKKYLLLLFSIVQGRES